MQAKRFEALDGWRGIAALAVTFYHTPIAHPLRQAAGWKNMEIFVDFFFVLSGFVIMHAWGSRLDGVSSAKEFMRKRFWRVWPLHFAILMAFLAIEIMKAGAGLLVALPLDGAPFTNARSWASLISNIAMLQSLNLHGTTSWNGPAWSISVEFWTYVIFMVTVLAFRAHLNRALLGMALIGLVGLATLSPIYLFATHDFGLLRAVYGFFLGAATYRLVQSGKVEVSGSTGVEIAIVLGLSSYMMSTGVNMTSLIAPMVFSVVILIFSQGRGLVTRLLMSRPIQALGLWSYSIYLVHALLFYALNMVFVVLEKTGKLPLTSTGAGSERVFSFGSTSLNIVAIFTLLAISIAVSAKSYRFIERPFMSEPQPKARVVPGWRTVDA